MCVAGADRALDRDPRLLLNLLTLERVHAIHTDYFQHVQIDIQPFMRKVVTTWMLEVRFLFIYFLKYVKYTPYILILGMSYYLHALLIKTKLSPTTSDNS